MVEPVGGCSEHFEVGEGKEEPRGGETLGVNLLSAIQAGLFCLLLCLDVNRLLAKMIRLPTA